MISSSDKGNYSNIINLLWTEAYAHHELGNDDEVIRCCNEILKIDPNCVKALNWKGLSSAMNGNNDQAISYFDKALKIEPHNEEILKTKEAVLKIKRLAGDLK